MDVQFWKELMGATREIDAKWENTMAPKSLTIEFPVPLSHMRHQRIQTYSYHVASLETLTLREDDLVIVDKKVLKDIETFLTGKSFRVLEPLENETKTLTYLHSFLQTLQGMKYARVVCMGGGLMMSVCSYIAEQLQIDLFLVPLTLIAMSDTCIGGKVRLNDIQDGHFIKNAYRSYYEPSEILMSPELLQGMTEHQIRYGMCKIFRHALYQSDGLLRYLLSDAFSPFTDRPSLLKAILWTVELKRVCIKIDPYIMPGGSDLILRAAHNISDQLEQERGPILSHSEAVLDGMAIDLEDSEQYEALVQLYTKFDISLPASQRR